MNKIAIFLF